MAHDPLVEARALAASPTLAVQSEYLRAILRVVLAIHDAKQAPAPVQAPTKRGK